MAGEVKYVEQTHVELVNALKSIKQSFSGVKTKMEKLKNAIPDNLKGEAAIELSNAIDKKLKRIENQKKALDDTIVNAKDIEELLKKTDEELKKMGENQMDTASSSRSGNLELT